MIKTITSLLLSIHAATSSRKFGDQTYGNYVAFTVDGQETFKLIYEKIHQAKTSVYISNYDLDPALRFVRGSSVNESLHLVESRRLKNYRDKGDGADNKTAHETHTLRKLLIEKAEQGVEIKVIVWQPRLFLRILPGADKRGIDGREEEVNNLNELAIQHGIQDKLEVRIDSTAPTLSSAHHEKIIIIDNQVGFCGGLDLSWGKWDTSAHEYDNVLRDKGSEPWHDTHAMVMGPVVWDMLYHFHQRWMNSETKDPKTIRQVKIPQRLSNEGKEGTISVVALRTWKELNRTGGIKAWYAEIFRKAKYGIYIENQFPFQDKFATRILAKRLKDQPKLKVIIVTPMEPNLPGLVGSLLSRMSINDIKNNLKTLREIGGDRVKTYALISQDEIVSEKRRQIYVHSKIMIVDDKWITIGSANLDKNGFRDSSEFNLGIISRKLASQLRAKLWSEHLGSYAEAFDASSFIRGFQVWEKLANDNGEKVSKNQKIIGHAYYYNFEEMQYPPPYPEAKGGSEFKLL